MTRQMVGKEDDQLHQQITTSLLNILDENAEKVDFQEARQFEDKKK